MPDLGKIEEAKQWVEKKIDQKPEVGLILGSGLGVLAEDIEDAAVIKYEEIPHFPTSTVTGHKGQLVCGTFQGKNVIAMQGRFHFYEGYSMQEVTFPVRVMQQLGVEKLLVTNAAGGINTDFKQGQLMIIQDHINMMFRNPLIGPNDESLGVRFPDMSSAYDPELVDLAEKTAREQDLNIAKGVYISVTGPSYETPAEIRMFRTLGADAVGMSTVPEVIAANHAGMKVLGLSCISNMAAGMLDQPLSHEEVMETTERVKQEFLTLVSSIVKSM